ncbi:MAG: hypothetical protein OSB43_04005 [Nocardioides sp.]|uniref:hypothetical protein n=1 Tax=Nocardioides sp. TaxID=35761 RepID=UPI0023886F5D|nr:hypothetical protein [Nocardioides sp.]MDE0775424.1 hypothetical protein [Nocardioides sp.]
MSQPWESWWYGGDRYDRETNRRIADIEASQSAARSRLASQMAKQQGNLQGQIDRLTEAFVAMVEYEDIRGELNEHADAAGNRRYAREIVPNLVVTGGTGLDAVPAPPEVHDYWLSWAVRGLVSTAAGGNDGTDLLARAHQLDPARCALLLVLIDAIRHEVRFGAGHLEATLPQRSEITRAQRALWLTIAEGGLGDDGCASLESRLRHLLGTPDPGALEAWVRGLVAGQRSVPDATRAAHTITAVAALLDPSPQGPTGEAAADSPASEDPLAELIRSLVDEGAPGEDLILDRMAEVRARMGFVEKRDTTGRWNAPAGSLHDLLLADLADASTSPGVRRLALRLLGPFLLPVVATLQSEARAAPPESRVSTSGMVVRVGDDGPLDPGWRAPLEERVRRDHEVPAALRPGAYAVLGLGVLGLGLMILNPAWVALAIVCALGGAALLLQDRNLRRTTAEEATRRLARADDDVRDGVDQHLLQRQTHAAAVAAADEAAVRIEQLVGVGTTATSNARQ